MHVKIYRFKTNINVYINNLKGTNAKKIWKPKRSYLFICLGLQPLTGMIYFSNLTSTESLISLL